MSGRGLESSISTIYVIIIEELFINENKNRLNIPTINFLLSLATLAPLLSLLPDFFPPTLLLLYTIIKKGQR